MAFLENRIPPPLVLIISLLIMKALALLAGDFLAMPSVPWGGALFIAAGMVIAFLGVREFGKAQTTINPLEPNKASQLVKQGVFKITRNPMYLGMLLLASGCAIVIANLLTLLPLIAFALYINRFQIVPEERAMRKLFGAEYEQYCAQTSRWI